MRTLEQLHSEIDFLLSVGTGIRCFHNELTVCEISILNGIPNSFACQIERIQIIVEEMCINVLDSLTQTVTEVSKVITNL